MEGGCCSTTEHPPRPPPPPSSSTTAASKLRRAAPTTEKPANSPRDRIYRGVRMRKWGKWVAEVREPNKRSRIWLGSYATPVAAARAYDTAVFLLRGGSARLNFPEEIVRADGGGDLEGRLSAAYVRKKAAEVGARVDAMQMGVSLGSAKDGQHHNHQQRQQRACKHPDLNQEPSPDSSDDDY